MKAAILKERLAGERRVAATAETVRKLIAKGFSVAVERDAGLSAGISDDAYRLAGAEVIDTPADLLARGDLVLKVQPPLAEEVPLFKEGAILVSMMKVHENRSLVEALAARKVSVFALELTPRITRAQSMDILSSQANLAGYKAVLLAAEHYTGMLPLLMTAAGTVRAAKVLVLGAGVAGLQAIATAKRLGAQVYAFDIRAAVKEQVKSLAADFIEIDLGLTDGDGAGGYARALTPEEQARQVELLGEHVKKMDIVITTAAVPGRRSPTLISEATVKGMKSGGVIVDLAAEGGGNCAVTVPGQVVKSGGVTIVGTLNIPSLLASEASNLFSRNQLAFVSNLLNKNGELSINRADEIVAGTLLCHEGVLTHPLYAPHD